MEKKSLRALLKETKCHYPQEYRKSHLWPYFPVKINTPQILKQVELQNKLDIKIYIFSFKYIFFISNLQHQWKETYKKEENERESTYRERARKGWL